MVYPYHSPSGLFCREWYGLLVAAHTSVEAVGVVDLAVDQDERTETALCGRVPAVLGSRDLLVTHAEVGLGTRCRSVRDGGDGDGCDHGGRDEEDGCEQLLHVCLLTCLGNINPGLS